RPGVLGMDERGSHSGLAADWSGAARNPRQAMRGGAVDRPLGGCPGPNQPRMVRPRAEPCLNGWRQAFDLFWSNRSGAGPGTARAAVLERRREPAALVDGALGVQLRGHVGA